MKKLSMLLATVMLATMFVGCGTGQNVPTDTSTMGGETESAVDVGSLAYTAAASSNFGTSGTTQQFISGDFRLDFVKGASGYSLDIFNVSKNLKVFASATPLSITVKTNPEINSATESTVSSSYSSVTKQSYGYTAIGYCKTANGSVFKAVDNYYLVNAKFVFDRKVDVLYASNSDYGFESEFLITATTASPSINNYLAFVPGLVYASKSGTSASDAVNDYTAGSFDPSGYKYYRQRESALTLPMTMLFNANYGSFTLSHYNPQISSPYGGGVHGEINSAIQYGSMGFVFSDNAKTASMFYRYPVREEGRYTTTHPASGNKFRYHPVYAGFSHSYSLGLIGGNETTYNSAMMTSYSTCYSMTNPSIPNININTVYTQNIDLFSSLYKEFGTGTVKAAGVPFSVDITDIRHNQGYNLCNGFVGQQIPMGYQLYLYGTENNSTAVKAQGETVLNFWSSSSITGDTSKFAYWKWISGNNDVGGKPETATTTVNSEGKTVVSGDDRYYLRYVVDGSEGMLDAYAYAKTKGIENTAWKNAGLQNANVLVANQNDDGSFWRTYQKDGKQYGTDSAQSLLGTSYYGVCLNSKETSMVPMRYLYKCYQLTGDSKYLTAANKCAEYCYNNFYSRGYYRGGATDLADYIDKEGAAFALYGFNAAYEVTGESKYLEAAKHAAMLVTSFTYAYDFKIPNISGDYVDVKYNPFVNGGVIGESRISTHNDYCDNYSAYCYYDTYKVYAFSGDTTYKNYALLLQKATKASSDYDGRVGYAHPAMMLEATHLSDFSIIPQGVDVGHTTAQTWLPWSGVAQIEPATCMYRVFGNRDVSAISSDTADLVTKIKAYKLGTKTA